MSNTKEGAKAAAATNKARDPDYYKRIGKIGGQAKKKTPGGWAHMAIHDPELHRNLSSRGGVKSKPGSRSKRDGRQ